MVICMPKPLDGHGNISKFQMSVVFMPSYIWHFVQQIVFSELSCRHTHEPFKMIFRLQ